MDIINNNPNEKYFGKYKIFLSGTYFKFKHCISTRGGKTSQIIRM